MDKAWAEAALRSCNYSITVRRGPPHLQRKKRGAPPALGWGGLFFFPGCYSSPGLPRAGQLLGDGVGSGANSHVKRSCVELTWQDSWGRWGQGAGWKCAWCVS